MPDFEHLTIQQLGVRLTLLPIAAAGVIGLVRFRQLSANLRYLAFGVGGVLLPINLAGLVLMLQHRNNLFLIPLYNVVQLGMLVLVYAQTLRSPRFTRLAPWLVGGFCCYALTDSLLAGSEFSQFRPGQQMVLNVLVLGLVGLYFRHLLNELRVVSLLREPMFWVSVGLLTYFLGYLQIALFSNYLLHYSSRLNMNVWMVHSILFIVLYCCYCRALWLPAPRK